VKAYGGHRVKPMIFVILNTSNLDFIVYIKRGTRFCDEPKTPEFVLWLFENGIIPLYTPLGGSWLNMAESIQNILVSRGIKGQHLENSEEIIEWLQDVAENWNESPTPFEWGGKRHERRVRNKERIRNLRGSGARSRYNLYKRGN
jgi:hypothetical protein